MKQLVSVGNGAVVLSEQAGDFTLSFNKDLLVGGGLAAGIVEIEGSGKLVLKGKMAFDLGMAILEAHSPAALVPLEVGAAAIADSAIASE